MARFHDLVNSIKEPGEDGVEPSIYDDLTTEYESVIENSTASVRMRDDKIAELTGQLGTLKSQNFDLLMKVGTGDNTSEDQTTEVETEPTIDTLFIKKKR
jgi:hypothetical protein